MNILRFFCEDMTAGPTDLLQINFIQGKKSDHTQRRWKVVDVKRDWFCGRQATFRLS